MTDICSSFIRTCEYFTTEGNQFSYFPSLNTANQNKIRFSRTTKILNKIPLPTLYVWMDHKGSEVKISRGSRHFGINHWKENLFWGWSRSERQEQRLELQVRWQRRQGWDLYSSWVLCFSYQLQMRCRGEKFCYRLPWKFSGIKLSTTVRRN